MIQVLERTFTILRQVAADPLRVWSIGEMANLIEVSSPTCFHIVRTMVELGYLESLGARKGYRLGPRVNELCHHSAYRPDLIEAAAPRLRDFTEKYQESALISVLHGTNRYVICQADPDKRLQVNYNLTIIADIYYTASGRLLLATSSKNRIADFIDRVGLPPPFVWPQVNCREKLLDELDRIRRDGHIVVKDSNHSLAQMAFQIIDTDGHTVAAALGCFVPNLRFEGRHREEVLSNLADAAAAISRQLQGLGSAPAVDHRQRPAG